MQDDVGKQRRVNDFRRPRLSWRALQTQEQETRWAPQGSHRYEGLQAHRLSHTLANIKEKTHDAEMPGQDHYIKKKQNNNKKSITSPHLNQLHIYPYFPPWFLDISWLGE